MPSIKPLFFECFLACRSGPETRNSHHILTIYPACTLPKRAWNTVLSTNSLFFLTFWHTEISLKRETLIKFSHFITPAPCQNSPETPCCRQEQRVFMVFGGSKSAWNATPSSNSAIVSISHPLKTGLKHDAVDKIYVFSMFVGTRSSPQIRQFYPFHSLSKQAWNTMLSTKLAFFYISLAGPK